MKDKEFNNTHPSILALVFSSHGYKAFHHPALRSGHHAEPATVQRLKQETVKDAQCERADHVT